MGWVDLQAQDVAETLAALQARPDGGYLRGIRHPVLIERDPDWLRRPAVHRGLSAVGQAGLCYDFVVPPDVLPAVIDAAAACPDTTFVLDHLGNPDFGEYTYDRWVRAIRRLGGLQNVFCKLSGILGEPPPGQAVPVLEDTVLEDTAPDVGHLRPYYDAVLAAFGPDRLMFGSDWPPCTLGAPYGIVVAAARPSSPTSAGQSRPLCSPTRRGGRTS